MQTTESLFYINKDIKRLWRDEHITIKAGWRSHREIAEQLHYGSKLIERCEDIYGVYAWAPEFSNVHSTFPYEEKPIVIDGEEWPHAEGYFQAMKAFRTKDWKVISEEIKSADPMMSWSIGQACKLRPDWERVKDGIMMVALREKFKDPFLKDLLLSTGDLPLVQLKYCPYWGSGIQGEGKNKLGVLLQNLRKEIKN